MHHMVADGLRGVAAIAALLGPPLVTSAERAGVAG
jgi:hypothetical protein